VFAYHVKDPQRCPEEIAYRAGFIDARFVQDNHSHSVRQPQGKLVQITRGEVFDVAVDIRRSSPRVGQWAGVLLSDSNHHILWVPPGFAHGYLALSDEIDFLY
jgi:dTDP-4-dehydrorhamnose 3,5-epimerase